MKPFVYITRKLPDAAVDELKQHAEVEMWQSEEEPLPDTFYWIKPKQQMR